MQNEPRLLDQPNPYRAAPPEPLVLGWQDFEFTISERNNSALGETADWAVVNYMAADCDLAPFLFDDLIEMKRVGSSQRLHVCAWFNGPLITDAFFARLHRDTLLSDDLVLRFGDLRFNSPKVLAMALQVAAAYPARHRLLLLSGHGAGWRGALLDQDRSGAYRNDPTRMQLPAPFQACIAHLQSSTATAQTQVNRVFDGTPTGRRADILAFDACDMGCIEAVTEFADHGDILIVSQDQVPGDGYPYGQVLADLNARVAQTPLELAQALVAQTKQRYAAEADAGVSITQVALAGAALPGFVKAFVRLVGRLTPIGSSFDAVRHAFSNARSFPLTGNLDLIGFVQLLLEATLCDEARHAAHDVLRIWDDMVLASAVPGGPRAANGLSIYAPPLGQLDPAYEAQAIHRRWGLGAWGAFLAAHHAEAACR